MENRTGSIFAKIEPVLFSLALMASLTGCMLAVPAASETHEISHQLWDMLLHRHVARGGLVDYQGMRGDEAQLQQYLSLVADVDVAQLPSDPARLAFWINAYNACVVRGVLDHAPLKSVKDVRGFFTKLRYRVAGEELTLDQIELRGRALGDWRIHFAVVCASTSCPILRAEAFSAEHLDVQLDQQTHEFLVNPTRGLRVEGSTLWASKIFQWYGGDFVQARLTTANLLDVLKPYLPLDVQAAGSARVLNLKYMSYDWALNTQ